MPLKITRKTLLLACVMVFTNLAHVHAVEYIKPYIPNAEKAGEGRLTYLFWDVYDATLFAPNGQTDGNRPPLALSLSYLRPIEGRKIADRSIEEMRKLGLNDEVKLADWHAQMKNIFPDVDMGITLTGVYNNDGSTIFYKNGENIGRISDPDFTRAFFDIWLDEKTSAPDLRQSLLGKL